MQAQDNPVSKIAEPVARFLSIVVGWGLLAFAVAMTAEILGRKLFGSSFRGMDELGGFVLAIVAAAGASYSMALRGHTRVDVFLVRLPAGLQRWLNAIALVAMAGFAAFAAWRGWAVLQDTIEFDSSAPNLEVSLIWPQALWCAGLILFALIASAYALHAVMLLVSGKPGVNRFYGPLSVADELDDELAAFKARGGGEAR